ncbi:MAG: coproporphyrinogen III oxidase, partial [Rhizobiales bacterium]|nr:coproporphyrinogen III oxidase [Hyphomicrobiales bacterium]
MAQPIKAEMVPSEQFKTEAGNWFAQLRDDICARFEALEDEDGTPLGHHKAGRFERTPW